MIEIFKRKIEIYAKLKARFDDMFDYCTNNRNDALHENYENSQWENWFIFHDELFRDGERVFKTSVELYELTRKLVKLWKDVTSAMEEHLNIPSEERVDMKCRYLWPPCKSRVWSIVGIEEGPTSDKFLQMSPDEFEKFLTGSLTKYGDEKKKKNNLT